MRLSIRCACRLLLVIAGIAAMPVNLPTTAWADDLLTHTTSEALFREFMNAPDHHPNLPNISHAGYRYSERPLPEPPVVANVREHGAQGDGETDDSDAFDKAIDVAAEAGGGAVLVPAGDYRLTRVLALNESGIVLRGEGPRETALRFEKPVNDLFERGQNINGSWYGGLIWIEPDGPQAPFEGLSPGPDAITITTTAEKGDRDITVTPEQARRLEQHTGRPIMMSWRGDIELARHIAGHESMHDAHFGNLGGAMRDGVLTWHWVNEIEAVDDDRIRFRKPLRLDVRDDWELILDPGAPFIEEVGVEQLSIRFPETEKRPHLREEGYNGIMLSRAAHCWVRHVWIEHADNGIIVTNASANNTLSRWRLSGRPNHHGTMCRASVHDNLFEDFRIESRPDHGLNTEGLSSGNVWRRGKLEHGTFDSHGGMSFDSVRTAIEMTNTGGPGGRRDFGPFNGRRMVHWNIHITGDRADWVAQPALMPTGALVGIRGVELDRRDHDLWLMPDGLDKGCIIADWDEVPEPADLFEAQLQHRLNGRD